MHFYHYKIKPSSTINHAVTGCFSGEKKGEIIVSRGRVIEIFSVNVMTGTIYLLCSVDFNARIRSMERVPGVPKDFVAVGSDSGKIVVLEYKLLEKCFEPIFEYRYENKLQVSDRFTPGQYLAVDQNSQAVVIGAIEETIVFYNIDKGSEEFSAPATVQKPRVIFFDLVAVHSHSGRPSFATLEAEYEEIKYKETSKDTSELSKDMGAANPLSTSKQTSQSEFNQSTPSLSTFQPTSPPEEFDKPGPSGQSTFQPSSPSEEFDKSGLSGQSIFQPTSPPDEFDKPGPSGQSTFQPSSPPEEFDKPGPSGQSTFQPSSPSEEFDKPGPSWQSFFQPSSPSEEFDKPGACRQPVLQPMSPEEFSKLKPSFQPTYQSSKLPKVDKPGSSPQSSKPASSSGFNISSKSKLPDRVLEEFRKLNLLATQSRGRKVSKSGKEANEDAPPPMFLRIYEWDMESKDVHVYASTVKRHANKLISVPPGGCHRGGLLICSCNEVEFMELETHEQAHCYIPQRKNVAFNNRKGMLISGGATYKDDDKLLIFLQSEEGDLYSTEIVKVDEKFKIKMTYVDTVPTAAAMCIMKGEFLFLGADDGNHYFYKIKSLGSEDEFTLHRGMLQLYTARKLENLQVLARLDSLAPVINCIASEHTCIRNCAIKPSISRPADHVCNGLLQFHFPCGRGPASSLRTLRHGVEVMEFFSHKFPQGSYPCHIWSFLERIPGGFVPFIVVSFTENTVVLSVGREIKKILDFGFRLKTSTLNCIQVEADSIVQVFPGGFRYICRKKETEWKVKCLCQKKKKGVKSCVLQSAIHNNQIALALVCKEIIYIEVIKTADGSLEFKEKRKFDWGANCMEFVPGMPKAELLVVCFRNSISVYSVGLEEIVCIAKQQLPTPPSSLVVCNAINGNQSITYLNIGFEDGSIQRAVLNEERKIENTFSLKLDSKRVKLIKLKFDKKDAILALSSRAWISFNCNNQFNLVPLLYEKLDCAANFATMYCPLANLAAVSNEQLVFLHMRNFPSLSMENCVQLEYAPRQSLLNPKDKLLILALSDYRVPYFKDGDVTPQMALDLTMGTSEQMAPDPKAEYIGDMVRNRTQSFYDCELHIFDPISKKSIFKLALEPNHVTGRMCLVELDSKPNEQYLFAAVKYSILIFPETKIGYVYTYKVSDDGKSLSQVDKTEMINDPGAVCAFNGHVLVGVENTLWLCDFQEKLVMNTSLEMPCYISKMFARGNLFIVLCKNHSIIYGYWNKDDNALVKLHEDRYLHKVATLCFWDDDIIVVADMYGYLHVVLLPAIPPPPIVKDKVGRLSMNFRNLQKRTECRGEPSIDKFRFMPKSYIIVKHYLGEIVSSLQKTSFLKGGRDVVLYTTLSGTVGVLVPFLNEKADVIFKPIEYLLKGKSHFHNKDSTEWPKEGENVYDLFEKEQATHVIDGNLMDLFDTLSEEDKRDVAKYLQKEPYEINEKLAEVKAKIYFSDCSTETKKDDS